MVSQIRDMCYGGFLDGDNPIIEDQNGVLIGDSFLFSHLHVVVP